MQLVEVGVCLCLLVVSVRPLAGLPEYRELIPGTPTVNGKTWPGVGHKNPSGGGTLNAFGKDFKAAGEKWTKELCEKDSDGDGFTNGQELGDPTCTWKPGQPQIELETILSQPGVATSVPA